MSSKSKIKVQRKLTTEIQLHTRVLRSIRNTGRLTFSRLLFFKNNKITTLNFNHIIAQNFTASNPVVVYHEYLIQFHV